MPHFEQQQEYVLNQAMADISEKTTGKLLDDVYSGSKAGQKPEKLEGKKPEMLEGKKPEMLEGKKPEMLDGKKPEMLDGKKPEMLDGKKPEKLDTDSLKKVEEGKLEKLESKHGQKKEGLGADAVATAACDGTFDNAFERNTVRFAFFRAAKEGAKGEHELLDQINSALRAGDSEYQVRFGKNHIKCPGGRRLEIVDARGNVTDGMDFMIPNMDRKCKGN